MGRQRRGEHTVTEENRTRCLLTNHENQPLELHLPDGVLVIGPRAEHEIGEADLATPQVRALARARIVTSRMVAPAAARAETPKAEAPKRTQTKPKTTDKEA